MFAGSFRVRFVIALFGLGLASVCDAQSLVGTWRLVSFTRNYIQTGEVVDAFGPSPQGVITYGADGRFSVFIMAKNRPRPADLTKVTDKERLELYNTLIAYAGHYAFDGKVVTHNVELSANGTWNGTSQLRDVAINGDRVSLTTRPAPNFTDGRMVTAVLTWERLK